MSETGAEYPGIYRAALEIALDNGGINRDRPVGQHKAEFERWLAHQPSDLLPAIDKWLSGLSDEKLSTVCAGEHTEMLEAIADAPPFTDSLLNSYFDEVC